MNRNNCYFCYDMNMAKYLSKNGIKPITTALSPSTLKKFVLFFKSDKLNQLISEYNKLNI